MMTRPILITIGVCAVVSTLLALIGGWPLVCFFWLVTITGAATLYPAIDRPWNQAAAADAADILDTELDTDDTIGEGVPPLVQNDSACGCQCQPCCEPMALTSIIMHENESCRMQSFTMATYDRHGRITGSGGMISVPLIGGGA